MIGSCGLRSKKLLIIKGVWYEDTILTSPNVKGADVSAAQSVLKDLGYYNGKMDGIYGEQSAAATRAAKWDLGYADKDINSTCDDTLIMYLLGKRIRRCL